MKISAAVLLGAMASAVATGAAAAGPGASAFGWEGYYIGIGASRATFSFPSTELHGTLYLGGNLAVGGRMVVGAEIYFSAAIETPLSPGSAFGRIGGEARAGFLVTPRILAYGAVGFAQYHAGNSYLNIGPGVEIAVGNAMSVDIAYDFERRLNGPTTGRRITAAVNWHLGN